MRVGGDIDVSNHCCYYLFIGSEGWFRACAEPASSHVSPPEVARESLEKSRTYLKGLCNQSVTRLHNVIMGDEFLQCRFLILKDIDTWRVVGAQVRQVPREQHLVTCQESQTVGSRVLG